MKLTISLAQIDVQIGKPEHNLNLVCDWTAEAARRGSDLVVFPELWDTGYALDRADELGTAIHTGRFAKLMQLAQDHQIHIVGSMLEIASSGAFNTAAWFGPGGQVLGIYRKLHLFRLMQEERYLSPGDAPLCLGLPWGKTGVAICYDLRFPELFRRYALSGAMMTIIPAQWPHPRMSHWQILLRARAIENQMIIVACNRVGEEKGLKGKVKFGGRSVILDAWGEPIVEGGESETLLTATVDLATVSSARRKIPVFDDRRPEIYTYHPEPTGKEYH